nr:hypothetical protein [Tanacetum cinerariifolium]
MEFSTSDYYRVLAAKKIEDKRLKTKKIRDAEAAAKAAASRSRITKAVVRDFYSAGFAPGANVYFSYDLPQGDDRAQGPFLKEDVMALKGLEFIPEQKSKLDQPAPEHTVATAAAVQNPPAEKKKMVKPKWLKM